MNNIIFFKPARQTDNIGDLLINLVEVELLRSYGQIVVDDSSAPAWFVEEISVSPADQRLSKYSGKALFKTLASGLFKQILSPSKKNRYYLVIQPGHTSRTGKDSAISNFKINYKMLLLKLMGCRIIRMGFSIGPFDSYNGWVESFGTQAYHYYAVRDNESLKIAKNYKFKNPQYFPDLAWAYSPEKKKNKEDSDYIVISLRSNAYGKEHSSEYLKPLVDRLKELLINAKQESLKLVITYQVKFDREPSIEIYEKLKNDFNVELVDRQLTLKDANNIYSNSKYVISNRLHVLLLAMKCGALSFPLVDLKDNRKITSIFQDNSLRDLILDIKENPANNTERLKKGLLHREEIMTDFKKMQISNKKLISEKLDTIFK